jgi:arylsulfatase A-like enzyme
VFDAAVHLVDVVPTILAIFGFESGMPRDGLDLSQLWRDPDAFPEERLLFGEADHNNKVDGEDVIDIKHMVRCGHEKLHQDRYTQRLELYDLASDPGEQQDLAARAPERVAALKAELERFQAGERAGLPGMAPEDIDLDALRDLGYVDAEDEEPEPGTGGTKPERE